MNLLFDQNLSPNLVPLITDLFPDSSHVYLLGLDRASDRSIYEYAKENDFVIVTKDGDYSDFYLLLGFPPKIIWIRRGNCSTAAIENILREHIAEIEILFNDRNLGILTIF